MEMKSGSWSFALADRNSLANHPPYLDLRRTPLTALGRFGAFDDAEEFQQGVFHGPSADFVLADRAVAETAARLRLATAMQTRPTGFPSSSRSKAAVKTIARVGRV
jgi:hypothetical protein